MAKKATKGVGYQVVERFYDKTQAGKLFEVGDDVSHFEKDRIADCLNRGLIKEVEVEKADDSAE